MKKIIQKTSLATAFLLLMGTVYAQNINVAAFGGNYSPGVFPGYPVAGTWSGYVTKTSGTIPANGARITISLVPEVPWTGAAFSYPSNWTLNVGETTSTQIVFDLTSPWTNESPDPIFTVPVISQSARSSTAASAGIVIQALAGPNWQGSTPQTDNVQFTQVQVVDAPLPVTLASFTAKKEGQTALLNWTTTEEANSERFSIEHSLNGKTWSEIGSRVSKGESTTLQRYDFTHQEPSNGDNYYRLKMIDRDRSYAYSSIQVLKFDGIQDIAMVYPNPASDVVKVNAKDFAQVRSVRMYDLNGRPVYTAAGRAVAQQIDVKSMTPGNYIVEITKISGEIKSTKIVIVR